MVEEGFRDSLFDRWWLLPLAAWEMILRLWRQHVVFFGIPFAGAFFLLSQLFGLTLEEKAALLVSFGLGLPLLSLLGSFLAILNFCARGGIFLQGLLMFPLSTPLLLLGIRVAEGAQERVIPLTYLGWFLGLGCIDGLLAFVLGSWALKQRLLT